MLAGMAWSMCSSTWKSCSRGPAPERSLLPSPPSPHHPGRDARGSANTNHEDIPSPELADRALVDARAAESSAYESTFSRAVEHAIDERHEGPLVERGGRGAGALVAAREARGITSPFYRGRGERRRWPRVAPYARFGQLQVCCTGPPARCNLLDATLRQLLRSGRALLGAHD